MNDLSLGFFYNEMAETQTLLIKSFLIGFTAAATLGPIALVTIQRTLRQGRWIGLATGFGVALADGTYGLVGALGLSALTQLLLEVQQVLAFAGGGILVYLGVRAFRSTVEKIQSKDSPETGTQGILGAAASIFVLTLSNPVTIMFFSSVYSGLMISETGLGRVSLAGSGLFALGVFVGSFSWWVILVTVISAIRERFHVRQLGWLNKASGLAIAGFGLWVAVSVIVK